MFSWYIESLIFSRSRGYAFSKMLCSALKGSYSIVFSIVFSLFEPSMALSEFWSSQTSPGLPNGPPPPSAPHRTSRLISPCFVNPLFLQPPQPSRTASHKRHRFKRSLRVRVSNETSLSLSGGESELIQGETHGHIANQGGPRRTGGLSVLRRTPALTPASEEEDEQMLGQIPPVSMCTLG